MSTGGQALGAVVGGVAGFFLGGPMGALQGAALGMGVGGYLDPPKGPTAQGPRLSDLSVQTSTYGVHVPRVYGTVGIHGNLLWLEKNRLKETARKTKQGGGKGGGGSSQTVTTYSYSATFALGLCEGPIAGVRRIWCMDKLIYNAGSNDLETIIASNKMAKSWRLYLGTDDQMPNARYEADVGVGNASAFRGLAYIVFHDFQLKDYGNTLQAAQFKVEVVAVDDMRWNVLVDAKPASVNVFSEASGGAFLHDFYGIRFADSRTPDSSSFRDFRLGRMLPIDNSFGVSNGNPPLILRGVISDDYEGWAQYESTDFLNNVNVKSESGKWFRLPSIQYVQYLRFQGMIGDQYNYCYIHASNPIESGLLDAFGRVGVFENQSTVSAPIVGGFSVAGFRLSTLGDRPFAYRISSDNLLVITYDENFDVHSSFSAALPSGQWPDVVSAITYGSGEVVCGNFRGNAIHLCMQVSPGLYRHASYNSSGEVFNYTFSAAASDSGISALYAFSDSEFIILSDRIIQWSIYIAGGDSLQGILISEAASSALVSAADVDVSLISGNVAGYVVSGGTIRSALEPLQGAYPFDVIQSGYKIKFTPRGQSSVVTIPWHDLGATDGENPGDRLMQSREMDSQLPARTNIKYLDAAREYATSEQSSARSSETVNVVDRELPIVLTADEAAGVAEVLTFLPWLERTEASIVLPPPYLGLEAADVITVIDRDETVHELRITESGYTPDGRLQCRARPNRAALYSPNSSGGEAPGPGGKVPLLGESIFVPLDIPIVDESIQDGPGFVGVMTGDTSGWPGAVLVRSGDGGQTWVDLQGYVGHATIGAARDTLPASAGALIDMRAITVDMMSGELESITRDQMLLGQHYAAYGVDGRWEIVQFYLAAQNPDGSYAVSGFVRGQRGTEWATGLHQAGDYFVMLDDPDNAFIGMAVGSIGVSAMYRGATSGASIDDAEDVPFTYRGVNLECLSPVHARAGRNISGDLSATFTRRSRLSSTWWTNGVQAPVGEAAQAYEIDVMDASTIKRTITASTPAFSYSAADQTADFGAPQSSITFRIYQLSELVGRGYVREVTL